MPNQTHDKSEAPQQTAPAAVVLQRGVSRRYLYREYWNAEENHRPYRNVMHNPTDQHLYQLPELSEMFEAAGIKDGDEIEIIVRPTGHRPFPNRIWKYTKPHTYEPVESANDKIQP